jgi:hypothetical protein
MADRDHAAFVSFIAEEAIFPGEKQVFRGRQAMSATFFDLPAARSRR